MEQIWNISSWQHIFIRRVDETVNKPQSYRLDRQVLRPVYTCLGWESCRWSIHFCCPCVQENFFSTDSLTTGCRDPWKLAKKTTVAAVESKAQMAIAKCLPGTPGYWINRWMCRCLDCSKSNNLEDKSQQQSCCQKKFMEIPLRLWNVMRGARICQCQCRHKGLKRQGSRFLSRIDGRLLGFFWDLWGFASRENWKDFRNGYSSPNMKFAMPGKLNMKKHNVRWCCEKTMHIHL